MRQHILLGDEYWQDNFGGVNWASESQYKFLRAFKQEAGDGLSKCDARLAAVQVRPLCALLAQSEAHAGLALCSKKFDIAISLARQILRRPGKILCLTSIHPLFTSVSESPCRILCNKKDAPCSASLLFVNILFAELA